MVKLAGSKCSSGLFAVNTFCHYDDPSVQKLSSSWGVTGDPSA
ncbi:MAG: hypothetical protein AB8W33_01030 [Arsenophonus endosymbiont of Dermacentor nuttalli]